MYLNCNMLGSFILIIYCEYKQTFRKIYKRHGAIVSKRTIQSQIRLFWSLLIIGQSQPDIVNHLQSLCRHCWSEMWMNIHRSRLYYNICDEIIDDEIVITIPPHIHIYIPPIWPMFYQITNIVYKIKWILKIWDIKHYHPT